MNMKLRNRKTPSVDSSQGPTQERSYEYLGPEYDEGRHGAYLSMLSDALGDARCRNVALSGPYGCGKSSILEEYRKRNRKTTLAVSLWSLSPQSSSSDGASGKMFTDRIEQEIVRQILYSGKHRRMPYSRFNRIHPVGKFSRAVLSVLVALLVLLGVLVHDDNLFLGLLPQASLFPPGAARACYYFLVVCMVVYAVIPWAAGHVRGGKISAAIASMTVERDEGSYFDKYLDEIIYFFEANPFDIVIFEDLDRFGDPRIYMGLRDLNLILNNAPGVVKGGPLRSAKPIRFVYALKDGVFEDSAVLGGSDCRRPEAGMPDVPGSSRVKFFDAIIPVVPFLSSVNAFDMVLPLFDGLLESDASRDVLRVIAPYFVDMRVMKELRTEFLLMSKVLLAQADNLSANPLGITEEGVLAMAAYKCARSLDFERIACGKSDLDRVYDLHQRLIERLVEEYGRKNVEATRAASGQGATRRVTERMPIPEERDFSECWCLSADFDGHSDGEKTTFGSAVSQTIRDPLCCKLIELGYIRQDYALYAATYPAGGRCRAVNYYIHHLRRDVPSLRYRMDDKDAQEVLDMSKETGWRRKGLLNLDLFTYALKNREDAARQMVYMVINSKDGRDREIFDAFLAEYSGAGFSEELTTFIRLLVGVWDGALDYLLSSSPLGLSASDAVVNVVLTSLNPRRDYAIEKCRGFLVEVFEGQGIIRRDRWGRCQSNVIVSLAKKCGYSFNDLSVLHGSLRNAVLESGLFSPTRHNALCALPGHRRRLPDLDGISEMAPDLYRRITCDFESFLEYAASLRKDEMILDGKPAQRVGSLLAEIARGLEEVDIEKFQKCTIEIRRKSSISRV